MWKRLFFIRRPDYINLSAKKEMRYFIHLRLNTPQLAAGSFIKTEKTFWLKWLNCVSLT